MMFTPARPEWEHIHLSCQKSCDVTCCTFFNPLITEKHLFQLRLSFTLFSLSYFSGCSSDMPGKQMSCWLVIHGSCPQVMQFYLLCLTCKPCSLLLYPFSSGSSSFSHRTGKETDELSLLMFTCVLDGRGWIPCYPVWHHILPTWQMLVIITSERIVRPLLMPDSGEEYKIQKGKFLWDKLLERTGCRGEIPTCPRMMMIMCMGVHVAMDSLPKQFPTQCITSTAFPYLEVVVPKNSWCTGLCVSLCLPVIPVPHSEKTTATEKNSFFITNDVAVFFCHNYERGSPAKQMG